MTPVAMYSHSVCLVGEQIVFTKAPDVLKLVLSLVYQSQTIIQKQVHVL